MSYNRTGTFVKHEMPDKKQKKSKSEKWKEQEYDRKHDKQVKDMAKWVNNSGGIDAIESE